MYAENQKLKANIERICKVGLEVVGRALADTALGKKPLFLISTEGMTLEEMHPAVGKKLKVELD